jgi:hypothetical protein
MKQIYPSSRVSGRGQESEPPFRWRPEPFSGSSRLHGALWTILLLVLTLLQGPPANASRSPDGLLSGAASPVILPRNSFPSLLRAPMAIFVPASLSSHSEDTFCQRDRQGVRAPVCALECHHDPEGLPRGPEASPDMKDEQAPNSRLLLFSPSPFLRPDKMHSHINSPPTPPPLNRSEPITGSDFRLPDRRDRSDFDGRPINAGDFS